jgi:formylmethanofuran dehydrogenase subunit D
MANKITLNMITQRSIEEGVAMEKGKTTPEYFEACSIIELHDEDIKALGLVPNQVVRVTSECGSVVVKVVKGRQTLYPGLAFIPQGVWANQIVPPRTQATGEPQYSGFPVTVEPAARGERRKSALELVQGAVGMWRGEQ